SKKINIIVDSDSSDEGKDSSDEDNSVNKDLFADNVPVIPLDPKDEKNLRKRLDALKNKGEEMKRGVVYLGRIPHGFYEEEMRAYFSQFGTVTRLRLSRNKKTGKSKHYAFIEFASEEVAKIVAETMNNYILYESILQCKIVPEEQIHEKLWVGANKKFVPMNYIKIEAQKHNRKRTSSEKERQNQRLLLKDSERRKKLQKLGIEYDFPGYQLKQKPKSEHGKHVIYEKGSDSDSNNEK
ncbi:9480_t:CDS:2, partial [Ambispora leptoticha]